MPTTETQIAPKLGLILDMGESPGLNSLIAQQTALLDLIRYATLAEAARQEEYVRIILGRIPLSELSLTYGDNASRMSEEKWDEIIAAKVPGSPFAGNYRNLIRGVLRTKLVVVHRVGLSSPWDLLLGAAKDSAPLGYSAAGILGLHRIMRIVMEWQVHRLNLEERRVQMRLARDEPHPGDFRIITTPDPPEATDMLARAVDENPDYMSPELRARAVDAVRHLPPVQDVYLDEI